MKNAIKATTHFYFSQAVLDVARQSEYSIGEIFGIGEDTFVVSLYPYSNLIQRSMNEGDASEVLYSKFVDEAEQLAECFWGIVERDGMGEGDTLMPDINEFLLDVNRVLTGCMVS
jgi:hypothetical protein